MPKFVRHKIGLTIGNQTDFYYFQAPVNTYDGLTAQETGVTELNAPAAGSADATAPLCSVEALLSSGYAVRRVIRYRKNNRTLYAKIIVAKSLAPTFKPTGAFRGGTIARVGNTLDATFS